MPVGEADLGRLALDKVKELEHKHLGHERLCAERYEQIKENQRNATKERHKMHEENKAALSKAVDDTTATLTAVAGRIDRLYNRAWYVAGAIISIEGAAVAYFIKRMLDS